MNKYQKQKRKAINKYKSYGLTENQAREVENVFGQALLTDKFHSLVENINENIKKGIRYDEH